MLSAPPWPSRWTGPPGQRSPRSSVPISIASELLRGPGLHSVHVQTSTSIESSVSTLRLRTRVTTGPQSRSAGLALTDTLLPPRTASVRERLPPRGSRACGCDLPSEGGRVGPRDRRVAAGAAGRADPEVWGFFSPSERLCERTRPQRTSECPPSSPGASGCPPEELEDHPLR